MKELEKFTSSTGLKNKRRVFLKYIKFGVPTILIVAIIVSLIGIYVKDSFELRARLTSMSLEIGKLNIHLESNGGTFIVDDIYNECDDYSNINDWSSIIDIKFQCLNKDFKNKLFLF